MAAPTTTRAAAAPEPIVTEVRAGLDRAGQKELPSKYLYDAVGSSLFEVICLLPEYGLARAGERLLREHAAEMVRSIKTPVLVAELGSGNAHNTRWILEALTPRQRTTRYFPIDISAAALERAGQELERIGTVSIVGLEREYLDGLAEVATRRRPGEGLLVLFLGGTIGNFDRPAADRFLQRVRETQNRGDRLLISTDLEKPESALIPAYDDPVGVTAAFNLNLLARLNRELDADFDLSRFEHTVRYDRRERRIEMHLRSQVDQVVRVARAGVSVRLAAGETIWTESSHKYSVGEIGDMARRTGYRLEAQWIDREWPFAQNLWMAD